MSDCNFGHAPPPSTLTAGEVADILRMSRSTFMRLRKHLHAQGFPRPLPTGGQSPVWSRNLVEAWISTNGAASEPLPATQPDPVAAVRAALEARIAGRAA